MATRIYTRTGDEGETGLIGGTRVRKDALVIALVGELDELNATLGLVRATELPELVGNEVARAQSLLFDIGAEVAAEVGSPFHQEAPVGSEPARLEAAIDQMELKLSPLTQFILPGGTEIAARLHVARTVCRRVERAMVAHGARPEILVYLNRLSDFLFVAARFTNANAGVPDVPWTRTS